MVSFGTRQLGLIDPYNAAKLFGSAASLRFVGCHSSDGDSFDPGEAKRATSMASDTSSEDHRSISLSRPYNFEAHGKRMRGVPQKRMEERRKRDIAEISTTADDTRDRKRWRRTIKTADPAIPLD